MLDDNYEALHELHHFQIPLIGIVDSNMDPKHFLYKFYGNNDSKEHLEFFFEFLSETIKDGRLREQEMFLSFLLKKLNKNCYD
jgi:ribosomal protein S2